jgi:hypothetical protein
MQLGGSSKFYVLLFGVMYLVLCNFAIDPTVSMHQILCKSGKNKTETLAIIRQEFRVESTSCTWMFGRKIPKSQRQNKGEASEEQSQEHAQHFI